MKLIQLVTYSLNRVKTKHIKQTHHRTDIIYKLEIIIEIKQLNVE